MDPTASAVAVADPPGVLARAGALAWKVHYLRPEPWRRPAVGRTHRALEEDDRMPMHVLTIPLVTGAVALAILAKLRATAYRLSPADRVLAQGGRTIIANDHGGDLPPGRNP